MAGLYEILFKRKAEKNLARLSDTLFRRVERTIDQLANNPRPQGCTRLKGREEWRVRVGDHRVVYAVDDDRRLVEILSVAHRRDVYRRG